MPDFTVAQHGTDSSGRPIFMTAFMAAWWAGVVERLRFTPTIVQGAFMDRAGGGAAASAGYHDGAGCLDLRVWDLTEDQQGRLVRELRRSGAAAWVRDQRHGMDPHIHLVLGTDSPLANGAAWQWEQYLGGRDGLSVGGRDYHWRPDPLVTTPPPEDDMAGEGPAILAAIERLEEREQARDKAERERGQRRHQAILDLFDKMADELTDAASKAQVKRLRVAVDALAAPDSEPTTSA